MMKKPLTALASLALTAIDFAQSNGVERTKLLRAAGLPPKLEPAARIEARQLLEVWELAAQATGDEFFGLHAGEQFVSARSLHVVGFTARNARSLHECYSRTVELIRLTNESSELTLRGSTLEVGPRRGLPRWPRVYSEMALSAYLSLGRRWTGQRFVPRKVAFQHAAPTSQAEYLRVFGVQPTFEARTNALVLDRATMQLPFVDSDEALGDYLRAQAEALVPVSPELEFQQRVRSTIIETLPDGAPASLVARRLAMSTRTLQRRLTDAGAPFRSLLDEARKTVALEAMTARALSVREIASRCGFEDDDSFRAAFRRWTGQSPRTFRAAQRAEPGP